MPRTTNDEDLAETVFIRFRERDRQRCPLGAVALRCGADEVTLARAKNSGGGLRGRHRQVAW